MQKDLFLSGYTPEEISNLLENEQNIVYHYTLDMALDDLYERFKRVGSRSKSDIYIPNYQRGMKWDLSKQSYFIESLLLRLPMQPLFFGDVDGSLEIIDGSQRVRTVANFLDNELILKDLEKLEFINGMSFSELPYVVQNRFKNTTIRIFAFKSSEDDNLRYELFRRINTFSKPLEDAEIRLGAFRGPFLDLVISCVEAPIFSQLVGRKTHTDAKRDISFQFQELVTRFFVYTDHYSEFSHDVRKFIDSIFKEYNRIADTKIFEKKKEEFLKVMNFYKKEAPYIFRRTKTSILIPRVRFEALSVGAALAFREKSHLNTNFDWVDSDDFLELIRSEASNSAPKLRKRIEFVKERLLENV